MRFQVSICSNFMLLRDFKLLMTYICDLFCQVCIVHQHSFTSNFHPLPPLTCFCSQCSPLVPSLVFSCPGIKNSFFFFFTWQELLCPAQQFWDGWYFSLLLLLSEHLKRRWMPRSHKILDRILILLKSLRVSALTSVMTGILTIFVTDCTLLGTSFPIISLFVSLFCLNQSKLLEQLSRSPQSHRQWKVNLSWEEW